MHIWELFNNIIDENVLVAIFTKLYDLGIHSKLSCYHFQLLRVVLSNHIVLQHANWLHDVASL